MRPHRSAGTRPLLAIATVVALSVAVACAGDDAADDAPATTVVQDDRADDVDDVDDADHGTDDDGDDPAGDADDGTDGEDHSTDANDDGTDSDTDSDTEPMHETGLVTELLGLLPQALVDDGRVEIRLADLERASALSDLPIPDRNDHDLVTDWLFRLSGGPTTDSDPVRAAAPLPYLIGPGWFGDLDEVDAELGWNPADIRQFVEHAAPPDSATVMIGDFPADRLEAAMGATTDGIWFLGPDDFEIDIQSRTAARPIGESLRLTSIEDRLVVTRSLPTMQVVRASITGEGGPTVADHPLLGPLGAALDRVDAYQATLLVQMEFLAPPSVLDAADAAGTPAVLPEPFDAIALGGGLHDGDLVALLAYAHTDPTAAEANAIGLDELFSTGSSLVTGDPWSELIEHHDIEVVTGDGASTTVVLATIRLTDDRPATALLRLLQSWDGFSLHR